MACLIKRQQTLLSSGKYALAASCTQNGTFLLCRCRRPWPTRPERQHDGEPGLHVASASPTMTLSSKFHCWAKAASAIRTSAFACIRRKPSRPPTRSPHLICLNCQLSLVRLQIVQGNEGDPFHGKSVSSLLTSASQLTLTHCFLPARIPDIKDREHSNQPTKIDRKEGHKREVSACRIAVMLPDPLRGINNVGTDLRREFGRAHVPASRRCSPRRSGLPR